MAGTEDPKVRRGFFRRKSRRSRRLRRGYVFPITEADPDSQRSRLERSQAAAEGKRSRRRSRHRRRSISATDLFLGFSVAWFLVILLAVVIELASGTEMFFVEYGVAPIIDQGTWIIGNKAYLPDGRVMELEKKSADVSVGRDITSTLGKGPQTRTIRWTPVLGLLLGVPMLVLLSNFLYRRFLKRKARRQEGET